MNAHLTRRTRPTGKVHGYRIAVVLVLCAAILALVVLSTPAFAAPNTPPPYSHSWYINSPNPKYGGAMYALGYNDGGRDGANCTNSTVVLDFGQVANNGGPTYGGYGTYCTNPLGQFTPTGGWNDLWNKLNSNNAGQSSLDYATNIRRQP